MKINIIMKKYFYLLGLFFPFLFFSTCDDGMEKEELIDCGNIDYSIEIYFFYEDGTNLINSEQYDPSLFRIYYSINGEYKLYHDASKSEPYGYTTVHVNKDENGLGSYINCVILPDIGDTYYEESSPSEIYYTTNAFFDYGDGTSNEIEADFIHIQTEVVHEGTTALCSSHTLTAIKLDGRVEVERGDGGLRLILTK